MFVGGATLVWLVLAFGGGLTVSQAQESDCIFDDALADVTAGVSGEKSPHSSSADSTGIDKALEVLGLEIFGSKSGHVAVAVGCLVFLSFSYLGV